MNKRKLLWVILSTLMFPFVILRDVALSIYFYLKIEWYKYHKSMMEGFDEWEKETNQPSDTSSTDSRSDTD